MRYPTAGTLTRAQASVGESPPTSCDYGVRRHAESG
jgi:hypothetical protein